MLSCSNVPFCASRLLLCKMYSVDYQLFLVVNKQRIAVEMQTFPSISYYTKLVDF